MSNSYYMHPIVLRVIEDKEFFNHPQPDIGCAYCPGFCDQGPVRTAPTPIQDIKEGSGHPREAQIQKHDTMHTTRLYCSLNCVRASMDDRGQSLFLFMCQRLYKMRHDEAMSIVKALPIWTLKAFHGALTLEQHRQFSRERKITGVVNPFTKKKFSIDCSNFESAASAYREATMILARFNPYVNFVYNHKDAIWHTALPVETHLCCWNDLHPMPGIKPVPAVLDYDGETNKVKYATGIFCGENCVNAFIIRLEGQFQKQRLQWQAQFYSHYFMHNRHIQQFKAPNRSLLKREGGLYDIDPWRELHGLRFKYVYRPIVGQDFPFFAELTDGGTDAPGEMLYLISDEMHKFYILDLMNRKLKERNSTLKMDGDEYKLGTKYFPKVFHDFFGNEPTDMKIHFTFISLNEIEHLKSNKETFINIIREKRIVKK